LTSKKIDVAVATMSITEERKKEVDFSISYFISGQMILVHGDSRITKYQDLAGKRVATIQGSTGDMAIATLVPTAKRVQFERNFEALQVLKERRVEAFVQDYILIYNLAQENRGLKIAGLQPFSPEPYGLAVRKGDKEWLDFINTTLTEMKKTGEFDRLMEKWFGMAAKAIRRLYEK
jgi:putative glutamine transport system substrate-binding protein